MFVEYSAAISLFGFKPTIYSIFIVMGGVALSYSLPVPMALGVLEFTQVTALGLLNLNQAIGLSISILVRFKDVLRTVIGSTSIIYFGLSWQYILKQLKNDKNNLQNKKGKNKKKTK